MSTNLRVVLGLAATGFLVLFFSRSSWQLPAGQSYHLNAAETLEGHEQEHSSQPGPGRTSGMEITDDVLESLLSAAPPLRGVQKKSGVLVPEKWMHEFGQQRLAYFKQFKEEALNGTVNFLQQPSRKYTACAVFVNHAYKFIWIRTLKTGSSSLVEALGNIYGQSRNPVPKNRTSFPWSMIESQPGEAERWWKEYFVFSTVRNPYSRFASAYYFLNPNRACSNQTFGEACKDPFLRGLMHNSPSQCRLDNFYYRHIREQASCLFTKEGEFAVDFIAQTENLTEDFKYISQEINKRKSPGVPPIQSSLGGNRKVNQVKSSNATYATTFKQYPHCLSYLDTLLASEFEDLGYFSRQ